MGRGLDSTAVAALLAEVMPGPVTVVLAEQIRDGSIADGALRDHLVRSALSRLAIDSPRYPSLADAADRWPDVH